MKRRFKAPAFPLLFALVFGLAFAACGRGPTDEDSLPDWLAVLIEQLESEPAANPPAYIARWGYASGVHYYLPPRCCDIFSNLYDSDGTIICHPDGGLTGQGDGNCPELGERLSEEVVWTDVRGAG